MLTQETIPTEAGVFDALAAGPSDGTPVLLLHGFPQFSVQWEHQLRALGEQGFRAVAPDQRGYSPGVRPTDLKEYATGHLVDDVLRIADALGWDGFHLAGHDWGAAIAWATATLEPGRVRTLTAVSLPHPGAFGRALRQDPVQQRMSRYQELFRQPPPVPEEAMLADFDRFGLPDPQLVDYYYARFAKEPGLLTAALNWYRAGGFPKPAKTCVPTLLIAGTDDVAVALSGIEDTANWVDAPYRLELLPGVGHFAPEEAPEITSKLLLEHLGPPR
ncbi:pimeloyl-ACP methyl ester carboxylesterase [Streptomyces sp. CG 926]|uniref:alpha/beta fold hydrolase n=1 Tax=Streptomyces sp. CG 926 TaxID=1882405 RepID=UPI000D6C2263|nr:alpha/beta hydrolase [Streptomyces sp. CG 926]PWK69456.1 pimeloyl-ACP methyl ester carboxylesterase [Streptomyces sp. CG 926]